MLIMTKIKMKISAILYLNNHDVINIDTFVNNYNINIDNLSQFRNKKSNQ